MINDKKCILQLVIDDAYTLRWADFKQKYDRKDGNNGRVLCQNLISKTLQVFFILFETGFIKLVLFPKNCNERGKNSLRDRSYWE